MNEKPMTFFDGNGRKYQKGLPKLFILGEMNDVALKHIRQQTHLQLKPTGFGYSATPKSAEQIIKLIMTYNYKTRYFNNHDHKNTLFLKSDHHVGFDVDSICQDCIRHNNIVIDDVGEIERLAC